MQQSSASNSDLILGWLSRLGKHFGTELTEDQIGIFLHALRDNSPRQINTAFGRCLNECSFMPKLAELHQRMPDEQQNTEYVSKKVGEMMQAYRDREGDKCTTWETEDRPGSFYQWFGNPQGHFFLTGIRKQ